MPQSSESPQSAPVVKYVKPSKIVRAFDFTPLLKHLTHEGLDAFERGLDADGIDLPAFSGISGGRTSGLMHILLPATVNACFENTGREHPKTYDFLARLEDACATQSARYGGSAKKITWLEYVPPPRMGMAPKFSSFKVVTYETASRDGTPFQALLETLRAYRHEAKGLGPIVPWARQRLCTAYMKIRVQKQYVVAVNTHAIEGATSAGADPKEHTSFVGLRADEPGRERHHEYTGGTDPREHTSFVGLRADEPSRVAQMRSRDTTFIEHRAPLFEAGITKEAVMAFWAAQRPSVDGGAGGPIPGVGGGASGPIPGVDGGLRTVGAGFDLDLAEYQGNCTGCFLKDESDLSTALLENETDPEWWLTMQDTFGNFRPKTARSYRELLAEAPDRMVIREAVLRAESRPGHDPAMIVATTEAAIAARSSGASSTGVLPMTPRRHRLVVLQEQKRAFEREGFSCGCEGAEKLADDDSDAACLLDAAE